MVWVLMMYSRISLKATLSVSLENFLGVLLLVCKLILRNLVEFKPFKTYSESIYFQTSINFNFLRKVQRRLDSGSQSIMDSQRLIARAFSLMR